MLQFLIHIQTLYASAEESVSATDACTRASALKTSAINLLIVI